MAISRLGLELIKHFESFYPQAYICPAGIPTIGYGTIRYPNGEAVKMGETCTIEQAEDWLADELKMNEQEVLNLLDVKLSQKQIDALLSFTYNLGAGKLRISTLLRKINANPNDPSVIGNDSFNYKNFGRNGEFIRWCNVKQQPNLGLIRRRKAEAWLFCTGFNRFFEEMITDIIEPSAYLTTKKI